MRATEQRGWYVAVGKKGLMQKKRDEGEASVRSEQRGAPES